MGKVKTPPEMITPEEMSTRCGVNRDNIRMALRKGVFPVGFALQMDSGQWRYIIPRAEFENWIAGNRPSNAQHVEALVECLVDKLRCHII